MRLFKQTYPDKKTGKTRQSKKWYIEFRDHEQTIRRWPAFSDKARTAELGRRIETLVSCRISGDRPDPHINKWIETLPARLREQLSEIGLLDTRRVAAAKRLTDHLDDFRDALAAKGNSVRHVELVTSRARKVVKGCNFVKWSDISASGVMNHLNSLRTAEKPISAQTFNFYLQSIKQFCRWMVKDQLAV